MENIPHTFANLNQEGTDSGNLTDAGAFQIYVETMPRNEEYMLLFHMETSSVPLYRSGNKVNRRTPFTNRIASIRLHDIGKRNSQNTMGTLTRKLTSALPKKTSCCGPEILGSTRGSPNCPNRPDWSYHQHRSPPTRRSQQPGGFFP